MTLSIAIARIARYARPGTFPGGTAFVVGAAFVAAMLVLATIVGLHFEQQEATRVVAEAGADLRSARLTLAREFDGLSPESFPRDPARREAAGSAMESALTSLDRAVEMAGDAGLASTPLPATLALFKSRLADWSRAPDPEHSGALLRSAFRSLENETARLESELEEYSASVRRSHERAFAWSVGTGAALLSFLGLGAAIGCRARERTIARAEALRADLSDRLARSDELLARTTNQLESAHRAVADRASELADLSVDLRLRTDEAATARRAHATILSGVTHELRAPLDEIVGLGHRVRDAADFAGRCEIADQIGAAASRQLSVIDAMIDMARIEAGDSPLGTRRFHLGCALDDLRREIAPMAGGKRLELGWEIAPEVSIGVEGDESRLVQALSNLLVNAIKFTERGRVALCASAERLPDSTVAVRFEIRDSGIGIPPEAHDRIFEPFVRADGARLRHSVGIGLGLPIARHFARMMEGDVEVQSLPGIGSTFTLTARLRESIDGARRGEPAGRPSEPDGRPVRGAGPRLDASPAGLPRGARILIVDDSDVNREVLAELLSRSEADLAVAENGREAVRMAQHARYDIVLMDLQMPEMDGLEATRRIRSLPGWADIPIVAVTTHVFPEDRAACLAAGMNDHLAKPIEPACLFETLSRWLRHASTSAVEFKEPPVETIEAPTAAESDLHRIPGLVAADGIRHVGGDATRLKRFLLRFSQEHASAAQRMRELVDSGDRASAARLAHTVKGLSATLGLADLSEAARALEFALVPEAIGPGAAELDKFEMMLTQTCEAIRSFGAHSVPGAHQPPTPAHRSAVAAE